MATERDIAFPILTARQLEHLTTRGHPRAVRAGEILFREGDRGFGFYVVLEGAIEIVVATTEGERQVTVHRVGQFTGDVDVLTGRSVVVTGRVLEDGRVLALDPEELRHAVDQFPDLAETLVKAFITRRELLLGSGMVGVTIIGSRFSPESHQLRDFATRNLIPFKWLDLESDSQAEAILRQLKVPASATPIVLGREGQFHSKPRLDQFARCAGLTVSLNEEHVSDVIVVGAGPAGLAASVYAASEGLDVLATEALAAGGQAGTSSRIENYLGFPAGISGAELTRNALVQAQRFGARVTVPCRVRSLGIDGGDRIVTLMDGTRLRSRCVLVSSGVEYRRLGVPRFGDFEGAGIYYAATEMEARLCRGEEVVVVGGGNSAGQAIVFLADQARQVHVLLRGNDLGAKMSRYLVDRIEQLPNVTVHCGATVEALDGEAHLGRVQARCGGELLHFETSSLFLFIGASPNTEWLRGCVELDRHGFVVTGTALPPGTAETERWKAARRTPFMLETSLPGVFAAGDVRSGSVKRCASAVGEGSMAVMFMHAHLARAAA
ncbi:MAG TPA: FAD-dependent oxidoreductase [Gemmatimonadales bacterium]|nr:FAD-dependent oxidoreductase [Gemmatimonadales bacterium]